MGVETLIGLGVAVAGTVVSARESQLSQKQADNTANAPKPTGPVTPDLGSQQANQTEQQKLAISAGGTVTNPQANAGGGVSNAPLAPRKTLLGS